MTQHVAWRQYHTNKDELNLVLKLTRKSNIQTSARRSLLSGCHAVSRHTLNRSTYPYHPAPGFNEIRWRSTALRADLSCRISTKKNRKVKVGFYGQKLIYAPS